MEFKATENLLGDVNEWSHFFTDIYLFIFETLHRKFYKQAAIKNFESPGKIWQRCARKENLAEVCQKKNWTHIQKSMQINGLIEYL